MKKYYLFIIAFATLALSSCEENVKPDPAGTTYPRVQLIEHFTGADCGYCPYGMDFIYEVYSQNPDNYVWVSNHYGFGSDEYSITGSTTIGKALGVSGAPNISLNRERYTLGGTASRSYHPYYFSQIAPKTATTATEMIEISREYDAESHLLHVIIKGRTSNADLSGVRLTVGVTESGMQGKQADYKGSWEGWTKFTHTHAIRVYASSALGDDVFFENGHFTAEYDIDIKSKWNADNCEIVAWITAIDTKYPVLNAAKASVVEGTRGGEDIKHGGVEAVAVSETYPESGSPVQDTIVLSSVSAKYYDYGTFSIIGVTAAELNTSLLQAQGYAMYPYAVFYLYLEAGTTTIAPGTYNFVAPENVAFGDAIAGERDDEAFEINYSTFYYVYSYGGSLSPYKQWLLRGGNITFTEDGFVMDVTTLNGSSIKAKYAGTIAPTKGSTSAPRRVDAAQLSIDGMPEGRLPMENAFVR